MTTDVIYCRRHPNVETGLSCGRCDTPICPKCAVFTDVGARCPDCAPQRKLPQMELNALWLLRAIGSAAVVGLISGGLWGFLIPSTAGFFALAIGAGIGYCVGESVSWATNRKAGTTLQVIAGLGVVLAYLAHNVVDDGLIPDDEFWDLLAVAVGIVIAAGRLRF
jgi:hypothetical protein